MKKIIFPLIALLMCTNLKVHCQTVLTAGQNAYRAGDMIVKEQVEYKDPGAAGKNIEWDFSMLNTINEKYKIHYLYKTKSDTTQLVSHEHGTNYRYELKNDTLWLKEYENPTTKMVFTKTEAQLIFPFSYGDSLKSEFEGSGNYCGKVDLIAKGNTYATVDATGELVTPTKQVLKNVIRVHRFRNYTEIGNDSARLQLETYSWYAAGYRYPVFETFQSFIVMKDSVAENFKTSFYYPPEDQISQINLPPVNEDTQDEAVGAAAVFTEAQLLPNPVVDNLYINYKLTRPARIWFTVHNNAGIPLCQTTPQDMTEGYQNTTVNMSGLITGVYTLYVHVDDMVMRENVVKK